MYQKGEFSTYLTPFRVEKGCEFTHTSIVKPSGSFYIPFDREEQFLAKYTEAVMFGEELHMTERHKQLGPVVIDLDFRFQEPVVRRYTEEDIESIVKAYADVMSEFFEYEEDPVFYVMEKSTPVKFKDVVKDGLHIIVPNVVSKASAQLFIRNKVIPLLQPVLQKIGVVNVVEDVVDEAVISKNNWQMYGSCKPDCEAYKVTRVYQQMTSDDGGILSITPSIEINDTKALVSILSIRNKCEETKLKIEVKQQVLEFEKKMAEEKKRQMDQKLTKCVTKKNTSDDEEFVRKLVRLLSVERANKYEDWIRVGWCLRNIDYRLMDAWIEFSKLSSKFADGECEKRWNFMRDEGLGIGSLHMWARKDSPQDYEKLLDSNLTSLINASSSKTHYDIAKVVHFLYRYDFVCASVKHNIWYQFKDHRWRLCDCGHALRTLLSTSVSKKYCAASGSCISMASMVDDQDEQERLKEKGKKMLDIANKLKDGNFKDNIMRECREFFYHEKFEEKLDSRTNLIGFENGVYDLEALEFRAGRPEDFVSFSTLVNYTEYDESSACVQDMKDFINKVLTNPAVREYVMRVFASFLDGSIREERFNIWTGTGANGKSKIIELFESAFGEYCIKFPITLLTGKRAASNAATSEIARSKGKRFACLQEPSEDEKLNVGLMKELSGGDKIQARALFKEPIEFKPQFKMILTCNNLPNVPSDDGGTWRRIRVVEFTSKFVENPNPSEPNEFKMDTSIQHRFEEWREHFMAMLLNKYEVYKAEGIIEPDEVLKCTKEYQRNNDSFTEFVTQEIVTDEMSTIDLPEIHGVFKKWCDNNAPEMKGLKSKQLREALNKILKQTAVLTRGKYSWKSFALRCNMPEEEEERCEVQMRRC